MAKTNRTSWEREGVFDDLMRLGVAVLPRHKFVALGDQANWAPSVLKIWLEHWRDFVEDQEEDFNIVQAGELVVMWRTNVQKFPPQLMSKLVRTAK